ncbi:hypothetical protein yc1106_08593 [Curvularia clavata]|uniref:Uncharacterized protein n=1 Tax=Curvularia clavata TaxID=95742 RepID=A0A9Q8ZH06_CURCL|nr:hypothetical protein yc1106_08593 [Curvularia clavata]
MSRPNTNPSPESRGRHSWISLTDIEESNGNMRYEQSGASNTISNPSRPDLRILEQYEHSESRMDPSPHRAYEHETLLTSSYDHVFNSTLASPIAAGELYSLDEQRARIWNNNQESEFQDTNLRMPTNWLPYTLRLPYLIALGVTALVLSIVLAILCWQSYKNHGLGDEMRSTGLFFSWRYTPTIVAVFFTQAIVQIAEDVKRTEAYARMASSETFEGKFTLFYSPKVWWKTMFIGFSRKWSGGHRGWILALSSLAAGVSILGISTFSSSLLIAKEVMTKENVQLQRYTAGQTIGKGLSPIELSPRRDTYSRTISGYLFNVSTSMWLPGSYAIVPFGTSESGNDRESLGNGIWQAETEVFHLDYQCAPMVLSEKTTPSISYRYTNTSATTCQNDICTAKSKGLNFRSQDGCEIQIQGPIDIWKGAYETTSLGFLVDDFSAKGGVLWTNMSSNYVSWQTLIDEYGKTPDIRASGDKVLEQWSRTFIHSFSEQCVGRDLFVVSPPWVPQGHPSKIPEDVWEQSSWENLTMRSYVCAPQYKAASLPVTASINEAGTSIFFDVSEFERRSQPVPNEAIDFALLDDLSFRNGSWTKYIALPSTVPGDFQGISTLLVDHFRQNTSDMLENVTLEAEASRLRTRFARELLLSSITESDTSERESVTGNATHARRRILVVTEVGITLSVLFLLLACCIAILVMNSSTRRRPLGLRSDPAALVGIASLLKMGSSSIAALQTLARHDRPYMQETIESHVYVLREGTLLDSTPTHEPITDERADKPIEKCELSPTPPRFKTSIENDWRPSMFHKRWLLLLMTYLFLTTVALLILRKYAREQKLSRTAFIYQVDLGIFNTTFSPHSVIATLIAIVIGLSWDGIDKPMRTLQPYLSMSQYPAAPKRGASLTYQSSYWLWAAAKAALHKHWILCLVAIGTTLSQILIVSMAAVFERQAVVQTQEMKDDAGYTMTSRIELRQETLDWRQYDDGMRERHFEITEDLLESSKIQWLYNALDEIVLDAPRLSWTKDEWVFTPFNIDWLSNAEMASNATFEAEKNSISDTLISPANMSAVTSAVRSRLECSPIIVSDSSWLDRAADVYPDRTNETLTGFALPTTIFNGQQAVVAYWTSNSSMLEPKDPTAPLQNCTSDENSTICTAFSRPESGPENVVVHGSWYRNFTIKWIVGLGTTAKISGADLFDKVGYENRLSPQYGNVDEELLYFTQEPAISLINCVPVIEVANASVTVARSSGNVLDYHLLVDSQPDHNAWEYAWDIVYPVPTSNRYEGNVSYGHLFMTQLLTAAHIITPKIAHSWLSFNKSIEETESERFNIRDRDHGLNVDFMSYANWHLAKKRSDALLNTTTLFRHSETTLQTFFKHFIHSGTSHLNGGRSSGDSGRAAYVDVWSSQSVNRTFTQRIEILAMNETATWISVTILILLIIILVVFIVSLQVVHPSSSLQCRIECLADILAMVAGSHGLISLIQEHGVEDFANSGRMTRLGWFKDQRGHIRWGVELVDAEGVEWIDGPEEVKLNVVNDNESLGRSGEIVDSNNPLLGGEPRLFSPQHAAQEQETEPMLGR